MRELSRYLSSTYETATVVDGYGEWSKTYDERMIDRIDHPRRRKRSKFSQAVSEDDVRFHIGVFENTSDGESKRNQRRLTNFGGGERSLRRFVALIGIDVAR